MWQWKRPVLSSRTWTLVLGLRLLMVDEVAVCVDGLYEVFPILDSSVRGNTRWKDAAAGYC